MDRLMKGALLLAILTALPGFSAFERLFAPDAKLWPRWQAHDPASVLVVDHGAWDDLLRRYVVIDAQGVARVDYMRFAAHDRAALGAYVDALSKVAVGKLGRDEQLAYWINLYNALTVAVVIEHRPVGSIREIDISPGLLSDGPWGKELAEVEGEALTLNDIEHRILRPIWRDSRIHYALNCASVGCPNLALSAYRGAGIDSALDAAARRYVNDPRGVTIAEGKVKVSKIYDWFIDDFGGTKEGVLAHLKRYAEPDLSARLVEIDKLSDTQYDWSLNGIGS